jgi:hypothetical protein
VFHDSGATGLVGVNLVALSWFLVLPWSTRWQKFFSDPLHWWDRTNRLEKVSKWQYALTKFSCWWRESQCGFFCSDDTFDVWDAENTWLISSIWISGCRQMKGTWISNIRRHGKHSGLRTYETHYGWQQRWLQLHQAQCS